MHLEDRPSNVRHAEEFAAALCKMPAHGRLVASICCISAGRHIVLHVRVEKALVIAARPLSMDRHSACADPVPCCERSCDRGSDRGQVDFYDMVGLEKRLESFNVWSWLASLTADERRRKLKACMQLIVDGTLCPAEGVAPRHPLLLPCCISHLPPPPTSPVSSNPTPVGPTCLRVHRDVGAPGWLQFTAATIALWRQSTAPHDVAQLDQSAGEASMPLLFLAVARRNPSIPLDLQPLALPCQDGQGCTD